MTPTGRERPMSIEEIELARKKVMENAMDLFADALLMLENRRHARAYALAHLAWEEAARLPMLFRAGQDLLCGFPVDWKKLRSRLSDHRSKISGNAHRAYFLSDPRPDDSDVAEFESDLQRVNEMNKRKNSSLYADEWDGTWRSPMEVITDADAKDAIERATDVLADYSRRERATQGKLAEIYSTEEAKNRWRLMKSILASKNEDSEDDRKST